MSGARFPSLSILDRNSTWRFPAPPLFGRAVLSVVGARRKDGAPLRHLIVGGDFYAACSPGAAGSSSAVEGRPAGGGGGGLCQNGTQPQALLNVGLWHVHGGGWSALAGGGVNGTVHTLMDTADYVVVAGSFGLAGVGSASVAGAGTAGGGVSVRNVAVWWKRDGVWQAVDVGVDGPVYALCDNPRGSLVVRLRVR